MAGLEMIAIRNMVCALAVTVCACGFVLTYNVFVSPECRFGAHRYDSIKLLGPTIVGIGVLLFIAVRLVTGALPSEGRIRAGRRLKIGGGLLSVVPAALGAAHAVLFCGEGAYWLLFAVILFTGPGLCLFVFGAVLEAIGLRKCRNGTSNS